MRLAIVIPTLNEELQLAAALESATSHCQHTEGDLVVVSDGGSTDATLRLAHDAGAVVTTGEPGRGPQLHRGAVEAVRAEAEALLFLHADTRLPQAARARIVESLERGAPGGGFTVSFAPGTPMLRVAERLVNARTRLLRIPLGDQAQFVAVAAYQKISGFPPWPILEDLELMRRLKRLGRPAILTPPVVTSARRFRQRGLARTVATNWLIWTLYFAGVSPHRLQRLYRQVR